ncbi:MAG TPA: glycosyltransferase family 39 protein [Flavobacteriales bacterium]|nr:glycosyltransferase family 39 protein [Flavobacteriales bacterium]
MSSRVFYLMLLALAVVTAVGSVLDVMEVDAAQYAGMSRDMLVNGDLLQLHFRGHDYLDKPPLLFWLSAFSFKVFGVHNWSYKLPSIFFAFLGVFATYRFAALHYAKQVAQWAALMFGSSAAFLLMTNDVRCDTILTGSVITAIWLGSAWMEERRWGQLLGCALAIAAGMLTKGPMGAMAPLLALGGEFVFKKKWNVLRDPRLYVLPLVVAALLVPMCIGLYEQHGLHGLRFYFWEQSFGRITGENRWKDDSSYFFFTHEVLWETLPWTPIVLVGIWRSVVAVFKRVPLAEYASVCGAVLVFIALSLSQFKLPHYLYVIMPLLAVLGAQALHSVYTSALRYTQVVVTLLLAAVAAFLFGWCFPQGSLPYFAMLVGGLLGSGVMLLLLPATGRTLFAFVFMNMLFIGYGVDKHAYPQLLAYQANARAGKWASEHKLDQEHFYGMQVSGTSLDFYAGYPVKWLSNAGEARAVIREGVVIYTDSSRYRELREAGLAPRSVTEWSDYDVQLLSIDFLLPSERTKVLEPRYLLQY